MFRGAGRRWTGCISTNWSPRTTSSAASAISTTTSCVSASGKCCSWGVCTTPSSWNPTAFSPNRSTANISSSISTPCLVFSAPTPPRRPSIFSPMAVTTLSSSWRPRFQPTLEIAAAMKRLWPDTPILLMVTNNTSLASLDMQNPRLAHIDRIFVWNGYSKLFVGMIKYVEDLRNVDSDTRTGQVRVILLIEDSVRYYSRYLPVLYKVVMRQTQALIEEEKAERLSSFSACGPGQDTPRVELRGGGRALREIRTLHPHRHHGSEIPAQGSLRREFRIRIPRDGEKPHQGSPCPRPVEREERAGTRVHPRRLLRGQEFGVARTRTGGLPPGKPRVRPIPLPGSERCDHIHGSQHGRIHVPAV